MAMTNAEKQRKHRAKMREQGYVQKTEFVHKPSYDKGYEAGQYGSKGVSSYTNNDDARSYMIGYIDGGLSAKLFSPQG